MINRTVKIMECSRVFALPMTILSWLVIFVFSYMDSGNALYGLISLAGLSFAHLGANVLDDYFDYRALIKQVGFNKSEYLKNSQKTKCRYLVAGVIKPAELLALGGLYLFLALIVGVFLYLKCGAGVVYLALVGGIIALLYPFLSRIRLSEVLVALAYGPALFGGVFYVMTGTYEPEVFLLSLPTMFMTVILLYAHTVMDYNYDRNEGKKTLANTFSTMEKSLIVLKILYIAAYFSLVLLCVFDILDWQVFLVFLTLPMGRDLYNSLKEFASNPESVPAKKWYHFPMEYRDRFEKSGEACFMVRIYQARNLMIYFSLLFVISMFLSLGF